MSTTLTMRRGDTFQWTATMTGLDLTGCTVRFTVKRASTYRDDPNDLDALVAAVWAAGVSDGLLTVPFPTTGAATVTLPPATTATFDERRAYVFDLQWTSADGTRTETLDQGVIAVTNDVTRTTP